MTHYCKGEKHWCEYSCKMEKLVLFCCSLVVVVFAFSIKSPVCLPCIEIISIVPFVNKPCALWLQWSRTVIKLLSCSHQLTLGLELQLFKFHSIWTRIASDFVWYSILIEPLEPQCKCYISKAFMWQTLMITPKIFFPPILVHHLGVLKTKALIKPQRISCVNEKNLLN